jgi:hypothetical protein
MPKLSENLSMLTFERLVLETAQRLSTAYPDITPEVVRDVLQDTGVDECLRDSASTPKGRLIVHYVDIEGEKSHGGVPGEKFRYTRTLGTGLWAWVGSNGTGKSTILNCILWALTGSDSGIPRRIRPWIRDVLVHFSVGDEQFTSHVSRTAEAVGGGIYHGWLALDQIHLGTASPVILFDNRDAMRESADLFFMQQLGITTLRWTAHSAERMIRPARPQHHLAHLRPRYPHRRRLLRRSDHRSNEGLRAAGSQNPGDDARRGAFAGRRRNPGAG